MEEKLGRGVCAKCEKDKRVFIVEYGKQQFKDGGCFQFRLCRECLEDFYRQLVNGKDKIEYSHGLMSYGLEFQTVERWLGVMVADELGDLPCIESGHRTVREVIP